jgi:lambda family phage portal protein
MKKNMFDRFMEVVSPGRAVQRYRNKLIIDRIPFKQNQRKYEGASKGRRTEDWFSPGSSANMEINTALKWLRQRSRDMIRNNPYAKNTAYRVIPNNVVGSGIVPTPKIAGKSNGKLNDKLKTAWDAWAGKIVCDFDGRNTFYGIQLLVMKSVVESGECIVRRVRTSSSNQIPLELQVLEADYIDTGKTDFKVGSEFVGKGDYFGIRFDDRGKRVGYWLFNNHPGEFGSTSNLVDAKDIIHVYEVDRPGQIRGVPGNSASLLRLRDLDKFEDSELVRQMVAASFAIFKTKDGIGEEGTTKNGVNTEHIEPGTITDLLPGENIAFAQPPVTQSYDAYTKGVLRSISAGSGVTYEAMTGDLSNVNFSSGRMGWIEFRGNVNNWQLNVIIPHLCDGVYNWFVEAASLRGIVAINNAVPVSWTPPRREMLDPYKEIQAIKEQLRAGLISWQDVVRQFGFIPTELEEELKQDAAMWDKLGLKPTSDARYDSNRPPDEIDPDLMGDEKDKTKKPLE